MNIRNYVEQGLATLTLAGSLFLGGCSDTRPPQPQRLKQRISQEVAQPNGQPDKYAVLISGNTESRHRANLSLAYQVLLENGFQRDNIYILDNEGEEVFYYPVDEFARKESIEMVFDHLRKKVDDQDLLFVYTTDHGERTSKTIEGNDVKQRIKLSTLVLPGPDLDQREFSEYLQVINPKTGFFLFDQCYSGGFAEEVGGANYIGVASTKPNELSYSQINGSMGGFFMLAFRDKQNSDANKDGEVSLEEAFNYMKNRHSETKNGIQKPFIQGELNPDKVFLK